MSEPKTNTDSICRKFCAPYGEGDHAEECRFARGLMSRCDELKADVKKAEKDRDSAILERDDSWQRRKIAQAERDTARAEVDALRVAFALAEKYRDAATTAVKAASVTYRNADDMVPAWIAAALERDRDKAYAERDAAVATVGARKALSDAWRAEADKLAAAIRFEIAVGVAGIGTRGRLLRALELYQETLK